MFDHPHFDKYTFENIPLDRDLYLMDEIWLDEYEKSWLRKFEGHDSGNVGYISRVAARSVSESSVELSWYANIYDRFHKIQISLQRDQFVACVGCCNYDEKPHIFVKNGWLDHLYLRSYSVFALIDAIDFKDALKSGSLTREKLIQLRNRIDAIAEQHPDISFISFADNVLLKSNWHVGLFDHDVKYTYEPEKLLRLIPEVQSAYREVLGLSVYAVLTQGSNAYYEDVLLHISATRNHVSLNSLGLPFAQLMSIDKAAKKAINDEVHGPAELYMDESFFRSLDFTFEFQKDSCGKNAYREPLMDEGSMYFFTDCQKILENLRNRPS